MNNNVKKVITTVALFAVLLTVLPIPNTTPPVGAGASVCSDLPDTVMAPLAD